MTSTSSGWPRRAGLLLTTSALAAWASGLLFLGAVVAPHVFFRSGLDRTQAGAVMAPVFLAFDRWIVVFLGGALLGELLRLTNARRAGARLAVHLALLAALAGTAVAGSLFTSPGIEELRRQGAHRGEGPAGLKLDALHHRAEELGRAQVLLCAAVLASCWTWPRARA